MFHNTELCNNAIVERELSDSEPGFSIYIYVYIDNAEIIYQEINSTHTGKPHDNRFFLHISSLAYQGTQYHISFG